MYQPYIETVEVEDWEDEGNAVENLIDKLESENHMGFFVTQKEIETNGYGEDEYITGGNHGLNLLHYGILYVERIEE